MSPKKIYIADKSQLVMSGVDTIIKENISNIITLGLSSSPEKILKDIEIHKPDIIFIDETIKYNQELPLIVLISSMYQELLIIALTDNKSPEFNQFSDFYLSKPLLTPFVLISMMKMTEIGVQRYSFLEKKYEYMFFLITHVISKNEKYGSKKLFPYIPMYITLDALPLTDVTAVYVFHFMETSLREMEKYRVILFKYISQKCNNLVFEGSEILKISPGLNKKAACFLMESTEKFINNIAEVKTPVFNLEEYEGLLNDNKFDRALQLLTYYVNGNEELNLDLLVRNTKKFIKLFIKYLHSDMIKSKIQYFIQMMSKDNYEDFKSIYLKIREQIKYYLNQNNSIQTEQELVNGIVDYVREHYSDNLTISSIAAYFQFEEVYLKQLIMKYLKMTFKTYVDYIRVETAADMLKSTNYTIAKICSKVGYANQSYFGQIFRQQKGCTMKKYRENVGTGEKA